MANEVLKRSTKIYISDTYNASPTKTDVLIGANRFPFVSEDLNSQFDTTDRNVVLNSIVKEHSLVVRQSVSGSITEEQYYIDSAADPATPTSADTDIPDFLILKALGINFDTMPIHQTSPLPGVDFSAGGVSIPKASSTDKTTDSFFARYSIANGPTPSTDWLYIYKFFLNDAANSQGEVYIHKKVRPTAMTWNFAVGSIVEPQITFGGLSTEVYPATATPSDTIDSSTLDPAIPKNMYITVGGTAFNLTDLTININGTTQNVESIATDGITDIINTEFAVTGSFSVLYSDYADFYDAFLNSTTSSISATIYDATAISYGAGSAGPTGGTPGSMGKSIKFSLPNIKYSNVVPTVENDFVVNKVDFTAANKAGNDYGAIEIIYTLW